MISDALDRRKDMAIAALSNAVAMAESLDQVEINQICAWADDLYGWLVEKVDQDGNRTNAQDKV